MKRTVLRNFAGLGIALALAVTTSSCDKLKKSIIPDQEIDWSNPGIDFVLPATSDTSAQQQLGMTQFSYNLDSMIRKETNDLLSYNNIEYIRLTSLRLTLSDADAANNFANFSYAGCNFRTSNNNTVYTLGYVPNNPDTYSAAIDIPAGSPNDDVKTYFGPNTLFSYAAIGKLRRKTTKDLHAHLEIHYTFKLKGS